MQIIVEQTVDDSLGMPVYEQKVHKHSPSFGHLLFLAKIN